MLQEQLAFFRVRDPEAHRPDRLPLLIHRYPGTTSLGSLFPIYDHEGVKVMVDRIGPAVDPANPDRTIDPAILERQRAYAMALLPAVTGEVLETTSCRYTMTPDEDFIIDLPPGAPADRHRLPLLGPRLQVRARHRPDPGRPGAHRGDGVPDGALRAESSGRAVVASRRGVGKSARRV